METNKRTKPILHNMKEGFELCIDHDHVTIPTAKLTELIQAKVEMQILRQAYFSLESYAMASIMGLVFGPKSEDGEGNAQ